jgi:hypothetical protein
MPTTMATTATALTSSSRRSLTAAYGTADLVLNLIGLAFCVHNSPISAAQAPG